MKILVTGATGFIGYEVARLLSERGLRPVGDRRATTWTELFEIVQSHYPRFQFVRLPQSVAMLGARVLRPFQLVRARPTILTVGSVIGWNLNLDVDPEVLWGDLGLEPVYPTIVEGIPAVLDDCVAYRWLHPVDDRRGL